MKTINSFLLTPIVLLSALALALSGCTSEGAAPASQDEGTRAKVVSTTTVTRDTARYTLALPGQLHPFEEVKLYPKVSGFIRDLYVDRGSYVKKGQLLARLDAPEITQRYGAAAAKQREVMERLTYSRQSYERLLWASATPGAVAALELEQAKAKVMSDSAAYESLKAEMAAARQLASYLEIRAPFQGVITSRTASPGALVGANDHPLFTLAQQDRLKLVVAIPEKHARALAENTVVRYRVSNAPDKTFTARISRSSGLVDAKLRALVVEFDVDNTTRQLNGGEYVEAEIEFQRSAPSLWVPTASIVEAQSGLFVMRVENDTVKKVAIKKGIEENGKTEVHGELTDGDIIVAKNPDELRDGNAVTTEERKEITQNTK